MIANLKAVARSIRAMYRKAPTTHAGWLLIIEMTLFSAFIRALS
jgi:hypothetical protein